ncbi:hypothetical protein NAD41_000848 [Salmonella enterica]|nr:hypothetical protein [Salmonella enterica]EKK6596355.1 hypothetical protein [Salmonella enterica]
MKTLAATPVTPCVFASRLRAVWEAFTTLAGMPVSTRLRDERLKVMVAHLKRDAAVTANPHLADVADRLEYLRKMAGGK